MVEAKDKACIEWASDATASMKDKKNTDKNYLYVEIENSIGTIACAKRMERKWTGKIIAI